MKTRWGILFTAVVLLLTVMIGVLLPAGCGGTDKPKVMVFMGKSSKSYDTMKPIADSLKKKYGNKVTFVIVDYDDPKNKDQINEYHVSMNPTVLIFNTKGQVKETFMGAAREEMLAQSIESYITGKQTTTSSQPSSTSSTITPYTTTSPVQSETTPSGVSGSTGP
jgi:thiol-disulfide isomerase/thioredoxin